MQAALFFIFLPQFGIHRHPSREGVQTDEKANEFCGPAQKEKISPFRPDEMQFPVATGFLSLHHTGLHVYCCG